MWRKFASACVFASVFLVVPNAMACSCLALSLAEKTANADLIFTGTIESSFAFGNQQLITVLPNEFFKGAPAEKIQLFTAKDSAACGYAANKGESHLIFARVEKGKTTTNLCDGSTLDPKKTDLAAIRGFMKNESSAPNLPTTPTRDFPDLSNTHPYYAAVQYLTAKGLISGFDDGSFRPEKTISRAAFVKIAMGSSFSAEEIALCPNVVSTTGIFPDIPKGEWYEPYACIAKLKGGVGGFPDGSFRPGKEIAFPAVAKILVETLQIPKSTKSADWYEPYVYALDERNAIPVTIKTLQHKVTRAEVAEIIWRLQNNATERESGSAAAIIALSKNCRELERQTVPDVDMQRVRAAWLGWHNAARAERGLSPYTENSQLILSADRWSETSANRGYMDHKREGQAAYYDYGIITGWFGNLGLKFANRSRITYSESIGWGPWRCNKADCTDDMIARVRQTFDFYLNEGPGGAHYNAIMSPGFKELGMSVRAANGKYYITTHYGTAIISDPKPICE